MSQTPQRWYCSMLLYSDRFSNLNEFDDDLFVEQQTICATCWKIEGIMAT